MPGLPPVGVVREGGVERWWWREERRGSSTPCIAVQDTRSYQYSSDSVSLIQTTRAQLATVKDFGPPVRASHPMLCIQHNWYRD